MACPDPGSLQLHNKCFPQVEGNMIAAHQEAQGRANLERSLPRRPEALEPGTMAHLPCVGLGKATLGPAPCLGRAQSPYPEAKWMLPQKRCPSSTSWLATRALILGSPFSFAHPSEGHAVCWAPRRKAGQDGCVCYAQPPLFPGGSSVRRDTPSSSFPVGKMTAAAASSFETLLGDQVLLIKER